MCVFFPLVLLLGAVVWILPIPNPFSIAWNVLLLVGIVVVVRRMRQAPSAVPGLGAEDLRGAACPSCGSTETEAWKTGATVLGLKCNACQRRTPGRPS
ncbi:MAG: hypothetical protein ACOYM9_05380 [Bradymonadia bacterium]|jgi:hypothetical protein